MDEYEKKARKAIGDNYAQRIIRIYSDENTNKIIQERMSQSMNNMLDKTFIDSLTESEKETLKILQKQVIKTETNPYKAAASYSAYWNTSLNDFTKGIENLIEGTKEDFSEEIFLKLNNLMNSINKLYTRNDSIVNNLVEIIKTEELQTVPEDKIYAAIKKEYPKKEDYSKSLLNIINDLTKIASGFTEELDTDKMNGIDELSKGMMKIYEEFILVDEIKAIYGHESDNTEKFSWTKI